jgi:hypothetical protein
MFRMSTRCTAAFVATFVLITTARAGDEHDGPPPVKNASANSVSRIGGGAAVALGCPRACVVTRTVTCFRQEWREREVIVTVPHVIVRTVKVPVRRTVLVPVCHEEKRVVTSYVKVPRNVEREVAHTRIVKTCVTDPCTGCPHIVSRPETVVEKFCSTVFETVPLQKEVLVKVRRLEPRQETVQALRTIREVKEERIVKKERYCVSVPYQKAIEIPVVYCVVCAAPCRVVRTVPCRFTSGGCF